MDKRWLLGKISNHNINRKDGTFMKTAVICMNGFEEVEGLTVVDMFRRLEITVLSFFREVCLEQPTLEMTAR